MADPVSVAAGIVGLTAFAIQSSKVLYDTIESIKNNSRSVRELKEELNSLSGVLHSLEETLAVAEIDFSALQTPLRRCGRLCEEFSVLIKKCSQHGDPGKFSIRDFIAITYKGRDITELRSLIAAYKSTIAIALADANIRQANVTTKVFQEYKQTIEDTTSDLQELLQQLSERTSGTTSQQDAIKGPEDVEQQDLAGERTSIEECLAICARVWKHIDEVQNEPSLRRSDHTTHRQQATTARNSGQAARVTSQRLEDCKAGLGLTTAELRTRLQEANNQLAKLSKQSRKFESPSTDETGRIVTEEDFDSIKQCLSICQDATEQVTKVRVNFFEDVTMTDETDQFIVSTFGDLISAKRITAGARSRQMLGQLSDESLQQFSRDSVARFQYYGMSEGRPTTNGTANGSTKMDSSKSQFAGRYGSGQKLSNQ